MMKAAVTAGPAEQRPAFPTGGFRVTALLHFKVAVDVMNFGMYNSSMIGFVWFICLQFYILCQIIFRRGG